MSKGDQDDDQLEGALAASLQDAEDDAAHFDRLVVRCEGSGKHLVPHDLQRFKGECLLTAVIAFAFRHLPCSLFHAQCDAVALVMRAHLVALARSLGSSFEYREVHTDTARTHAHNACTHTHTHTHPPDVGHR